MYYLYILKCADKSFYTGIAKDLDKRIEKHRTGKGSKYVYSRLPVDLIYTENFADKSGALKREMEIKSWKREKKIEILKLEKFIL